MSHSLAQEIGFVADALKQAEELEKLLAQKITAAVRRDVHALVAALSGSLLVADFALTGDGDGQVRARTEDIRDNGLYALAA